MGHIELLHELGDIWALDYSKAGPFFAEAGDEQAAKTRMPRLPKVSVTLREGFMQ